MRGEGDGVGEVAAVQETGDGAVPPIPAHHLAAVDPLLLHLQRVLLGQSKLREVEEEHAARAGGWKSPSAERVEGVQVGEGGCAQVTVGVLDVSSTD